MSLVIDINEIINALPAERRREIEKKANLLIAEEIANHGTVGIKEEVLVDSLSNVSVNSFSQL